MPLKPEEAELVLNEVSALGLTEITFSVRLVIDSDIVYDSKFDPERILNDWVNPRFESLWKLAHDEQGKT